MLIFFPYINEAHLNNSFNTVFIPILFVNQAKDDKNHQYAFLI